MHPGWVLSIALGALATLGVACYLALYFFGSRWACSSHGHADWARGECVCDEGWSGPACSGSERHVTAFALTDAPLHTGQTLVFPQGNRLHLSDRGELAFTPAYGKPYQLNGEFKGSRGDYTMQFDEDTGQLQVRDGSGRVAWTTPHWTEYCCSPPGTRSTGGGAARALREVDLYHLGVVDKGEDRDYLVWQTGAEPLQWKTWCKNHGNVPVYDPAPVPDNNPCTPDDNEFMMVSGFYSTRTGNWMDPSKVLWMNDRVSKVGCSFPVDVRWCGSRDKDPSYDLCVNSGCHGKFYVRPWDKPLYSPKEHLDIAGKGFQNRECKSQDFNPQTCRWTGLGLENFCIDGQRGAQCAAQNKKTEK